jgi:hypothetical protein
MARHLIRGGHRVALVARGLHGRLIGDGHAKVMRPRLGTRRHRLGGHGFQNFRLGTPTAGIGPNVASGVAALIRQIFATF